MSGVLCSEEHSPTWSYTHINPRRHQIQSYTPGTGIPHSHTHFSGNICAETFTQLQDEFKTNWGLLINKPGDKETPLNIIPMNIISQHSRSRKVQEAHQLHPLCSRAGRLGRLISFYSTKQPLGSPVLKSFLNNRSLLR